MAVIISDTGPINYLVLLERVELLGEMFEKVILPGAVRDELLHEKAPSLVRDWITSERQWVEIRAGISVETLPLEYQEQLRDLGEGEVEAIALAYDTKFPVIMDDREAREIAENCGLAIVGTLGILAEAHNRRMLDYREETTKLTELGFRGSQRVIDLVFRTQCEV